MPHFRYVALIIAALLPANVLAQDVNANYVNVYSSRKEILVKDLFDQFTDETGIEVRFVKDKAPKLIARLQSEGQYSEADILLTADVGNLLHAQELGLLQPVRSEILEEVIPHAYREREGFWYGLSLRVRAIFYVKDKIDPSTLNYWNSANHALLIRSSSNIYNQSLIAGLLDTARDQKYTIEQFESKLTDWVKNFARKPQGGDTDQLRALAAGEGDIAIANSYYYGRLVASDKLEDQEVVSKIGIVIPDIPHVNISGGGVTKYAKNKENAVKLLEFLASPKAQAYYAHINHEYPVRRDVEVSDIVKNFGTLNHVILPVYTIKNYRADIIKMMDRAGWR